LIRTLRPRLLLLLRLLRRLLSTLGRRSLLPSLRPLGLIRTLRLGLFLLLRLLLRPLLRRLLCALGRSLRAFLPLGRLLSMLLLAATLLIALLIVLSVDGNHGA
jgi:hypothetical protein